ncbi:MAG: TonB-dependent receptor family protein [Panacagrimonas sp.]
MATPPAARAAEEAADASAPVAAVPAEAVTVTATRSARPAFEVPASIDVVDGTAFNQDTLGVNLSEGLGAVPGLLARDRQNYAQDTQISIRGFGSRATFGIRGLRLYLDGIPASQPDGQGQVSHFNLASADRVEVLRGPFSTLYGNSSGGVIQLFTADGEEPTRVTFGGAGGSYGTWRTNLGASGRSGAMDYTFDYTHFETDGYRDHSEAERESVNGKLNFAVGTDGKLTLLANHFDSPDVQDPLGLERGQFRDDPEQATSVAEQFNTRKSVRQSQGGAIYEQKLGAHTLRLLGYGGNREVEQYLAIPTGPQGGAFHSGGVVDLDSDYYGSDLRWTWRGLIDGLPLSVIAGLTYDELSQDRRGYQNFTGSGVDQVLGVRGALKRDEVNDIYNFDQYVQASFDVGQRGSVMVGLRRSKVTFDSDDKFIVEPTNRDDSGRAEFSQVTPAIGLMYRLQPSLHVYGSFARGFETPTFAELAYRPDGLPGLNFELDPSRSANAEVGAKWKLANRTRVNLALFQTSTRDEIVVATNTGGRSTFQNAGRTGRRGVELGIESRPVGLVNLQFAWTYLDAEVREDYFTCTGTPCPVPTTLVARGNDIPGVPESALFGAIGWGGDTGLRFGIDARYLDSVPVNDVNGESAPSYTLVGADLAYGFAFGWGRVRAFVRGDNLFDEEYVGSVIVNDGNGRYYEPGPECSVLAGLRMDWNP